jgi:iron complex outermembrane receptor protein
VRAFPRVLACALTLLLYALPSYAQEPAPASPDAGAPVAPAESAPTAAPPQPGPPATPVAEPATATPVAGPAPSSEPAASVVGNESGEIEVTTSRKRVEAVQETPVAVSVVSSRQLNGAEGAKIHNLDDLSGTVPSFTVDAQQTSAGLVALSIRGISFTDVEKSFDMPIGIVIDGVYVASNSGVNFQNFDLQSIEVLRGPQGTLFGRNTTGGLLNIRTVLPKTDEWTAKVVARGGSFGQRDLLGSVNVPVVPDYVGLKLSGAWTNMDGWYTNISREFNPASQRFGPEPATHNLDGIADLLVTPTKALSLRLKYEHLRMRGTYGGRSFFPDPTTAECNAPQTIPNPNTITAATMPTIPGLTFKPRYCSTTLTAANGQQITLGPYDSIQGWGHNQNDADFNMVTGEASYEINKEHKIVSVTGWRHSHEYLELEDDSIPQVFLDSIRTYNTDQVSEELRLHGSPLPTVNYVVGGLVWHSYYDYNQPVENILQQPAITGGALPPGFVSLTESSQETLSAAGFGQADWEFVKNTRLTAGLRYTWEQKEFHLTSGIAPSADGQIITKGLLAAGYVNANPPTGSWSNLSPRAGLDYRLGHSIMGATNDGLLYGTYSRGFHSGGYNDRATTAVEVGPFKPEFVDSFEAGVKSSWSRNRLIMNVAGFYTIFHDKQEFIPTAAPAGSANPVLTIPLNAAQASIKGLEYEVQAMPLRGRDVPVIGNFRLWTTGAILNARYDDFSESFGVVPGTRTPNRVASFAGTPLVRAPDFQTAVGATIPFELTPNSRFILDGQLRYRTEMAMGFATTPDGQTRNPLANSPAASRVDVSVTYEIDQIVRSLSGRITAYCRNLTNQVTLGNLGNAPGITWLATYLPPRSYGAEVALNF